MPFESDNSSYNDVNNVQLCAYRPAPLENKFTGTNSGTGPPSSTMPQRCAVEVSRVCLSYGRGASVKPVLNSISLNVPEAGM